MKLCNDGFHIACSPASEQTYANLIFDAIGRADLKKCRGAAPIFGVARGRGVRSPP